MASDDLVVTKRWRESRTAQGCTVRTRDVYVGGSESGVWTREIELSCLEIDTAQGRAWPERKSA